MTTVQSTSAFAADATRFATDSQGNGSYYLPDSDAMGQNLNVPGTLTVGGLATFESTVTVGSTAEPANLTTYGTITGSGLITGSGFQGTNPADGNRAAFGQGLIANTVTIAGSGGSVLLLGDAATPGGNILAYNGSAVTGRVNIGNGFSSKASSDISGTLTVTTALAVGGQLNGQIYAVNNLGFGPPIFPYGMVGGQNATPYVLAQPTNGTPLQGAAVTWDGSPINIQLNGSVSANAQTFFNIIIPTSFKDAANSGKVLYFGQIVMGGGAGAGVLVNVYDNVIGVATLLNQFGMNPTQTGGAVRGFQGLYEYLNPVYQPYGYISRFSYAGIESQ